MKGSVKRKCEKEVWRMCAKRVSLPSLSVHEDTAKHVVSQRYIYVAATQLLLNSNILIKELGFVPFSFQ